MSKDEEILEFLKIYVKNSKDRDTIIKIIAARTMETMAIDTLNDLLDRIYKKMAE